jgi:hypothetical protein
MLFTGYKWAGYFLQSWHHWHSLVRLLRRKDPGYGTVPDGLAAALVDDDGLLAAEAAHLEALQGLHPTRLVHRHNVAPQALQARRHRLGNLSHYGEKKNQCWGSVTF